MSENKEAGCTKQSQRNSLRDDLHPTSIAEELKTKNPEAIKEGTNKGIFSRLLISRSRYSYQNWIKYTLATLLYDYSWDYLELNRYSWLIRDVRKIEQYYIYIKHRKENEESGNPKNILERFEGNTNR